MDPKRPFTFMGFFFIGCLVAFSLQIYLFSPISPHILHLPSTSFTHSLSLPPNTLLQGVTKIGEGIIKDSEDVSVDKDGILYTASRDGWIRRLHQNGSLEDWKWINSTGLLGMTISPSTNDLIICDAEEGEKLGEREEKIIERFEGAFGSRCWNGMVSELESYGYGMGTSYFKKVVWLSQRME